MGKAQRAVKKAAKMAADLHEEIYGPPPELDENGEEKAADPDEILDNLNAANSLDGDSPASDGVPEDVPEPILAVVPDVEPVTPELTPAQPGGLSDRELLEKAEHKYSVLQGMHRKMLDENNDMRMRMDALEASTPVAEPVAQPDMVANGTITDEDVEDYGSDLINMVKRAAHEEFSPAMAKLEAENEALRNQLTGVTSNIDAKAKTDIYGTLAKNVPNWEQINNSEEFLFWLAQEDPFSGGRRHDLLTQAFQTNNSARVITFFNAFLNEDTAVTPSEPAAAPAAPVQHRVDLASMAAPGRAQAGGHTGNQTDIRTYSREQIAAHYRDVRTGKFLGSAADKLRIEHEFSAAAQEGRVA